MEIGNIKFTDNQEKTIEEKNKAIKKALLIIGLDAQNFAKMDCPVDTGRLRNSISHDTNDKDTIYVGTNVEYAPEVEFNDSVSHTTGKAHFLRDAITLHLNEYKDTFEKTLKE